MQVFESDKIHEKIYQEKLDNGLTVFIYPRKGINKKYIVWGVNFGSIDNHFVIPETGEEVQMPDGIAHYLEHKMFEQKDKPNALDTLCAMGVDANAYTTTYMTAYLYEAQNNFYEALDEFMDYVQNPYFTQENVDKERGIIAQEINMYEDYPEEALYINLLKNMYKNHGIRIEVAGTVSSILNITPEMLYKNYNTFYRLDNMALAVCGDFEVEEILNEIKKRIILTSNNKPIERIYPEEPREVNPNQRFSNREVTIPLFMIGYKDEVTTDEYLRKDLAIDILMNIIMGPSSDLHQRLYKEGMIFAPLAFDYDYSKTYAHVLIQGKSYDPGKVSDLIKEEIEKYKKNGINEKDFIRCKNKLYAEIVKDYDDLAGVGNTLVSDYFKDIKPFSDFEEFDKISIEYIQKLLDNIYVEKYCAESRIFPYVER